MSAKVIYRGRKFALTVEDVTLPNGATAKREIVRHPGAVVVLPLFDDGTVLVERHWRASVKAEILELPAGTLESGEAPAECAQRELAEETGLSAAEMVPLGAFYTSPGILSELMYAFLARGLERGETSLEADEVLVPVEMPFDDVLRMAAAGELKDAKTIATLFLADAYLKKKDGA